MEGRSERADAQSLAALAERQPPRICSLHHVITKVEETQAQLLQKLGEIS